MLGLFLWMVGGMARNAAKEWRAHAQGKLNEKEVERFYGGMCVGVIAICVLAAFTNAVLHHVMLHAHMANLQAASVQRIDVGDHAITDRGQIAEIVRDLNQPEWVALTRGDAADRVPLVLHLSNGSQTRYAARKYTRGEGVVVETESAAVLCLRLPLAFDKAGISLPPCYTSGSKRYCAED